MSSMYFGKTIKARSLKLLLQSSIGREHLDTGISATDFQVSFAHSSPRKSWKLSQETHIVLEQQRHFCDAVLHHRQTIHAHAESEARIFLRIVANEAVHG